MIKRTNLYYHFLISFVIISIFSNCSKKESFVFKKETLTTESVLGCKSEDCANMEVVLLKATNDNQIAVSINKEIELLACTILNVGKNESEESAEEALHQFNSSYQDMNEEFPDETIKYEASIDSDLSYQSENVISIAIDSYVFTGGAHGYGGISYLTIDPKNGKKITNKSLLSNKEKFTTYSEKQFRAENKIPEGESINSTGFFFEDDKFELPENIGITPNDIILYYNQYEISSYTGGPIELKLNKKDVASYFSVDIL